MLSSTPFVKHPEIFRSALIAERPGAQVRSLTRDSRELRDRKSQSVLRSQTGIERPRALSQDAPPIWRRSSVELAPWERRLPPCVSGSCATPSSGRLGLSAGGTRCSIALSTSNIWTSFAPPMSSAALPASPLVTWKESRRIAASASTFLDDSQPSIASYVAAPRTPLKAPSCAPSLAAPSSCATATPSTCAVTTPNTCAFATPSTCAVTTPSAYPVAGAPQAGAYAGSPTTPAAYCAISAPSACAVTAGGYAGSPSTPAPYRVSHTRVTTTTAAVAAPVAMCSALGSHGGVVAHRLSVANARAAQKASAIRSGGQSTTHAALLAEPVQRLPWISPLASYRSVSSLHPPQPLLVR